MKIQYFSETSVEFLKQQFSIYEQDYNVKGLLVLACDANNYIPQEIDPVLQALKKPVFGGVFPAILFNNRKHDKGFILVGCERDITVNIIEKISLTDTVLDDEILKLSDNYTKTKTMFIFIDGFAERINSFIESIFTIYGLEFNYIGGGAGSLSLKQKPCILTNKGLKQDCAILAGIDLDSGIGVKHGWSSISGPYKVTAAEKTVIKELDFKPAFNVYKEAVEKHSGKTLYKNNFFNVAKGYPFGINKIDAEKVVRDPLFIGEDNSLICVGEVETGCFVDILSGNKNSLVIAAKHAIKDSFKNFPGIPANFIFFIDCISRVLFLNEDFSHELDDVYSFAKGLPLFGALTIGEIANNGKEYLEFYNKTSVIGCL